MQACSPETHVFIQFMAFLENLFLNFPNFGGRDLGIYLPKNIYFFETIIFRNFAALLALLYRNSSYRELLEVSDADLIGTLPMCSI